MSYRRIYKRLAAELAVRPIGADLPAPPPLLLAPLAPPAQPAAAAVDAADAEIAAPADAAPADAAPAAPAAAEALEAPAAAAALEMPAAAAALEVPAAVAALEALVEPAAAAMIVTRAEPVAPAAPAIEEPVARIVSDIDKKLQDNMSGFFGRAFRAVPMSIEVLMKKNSTDAYTKWSDDDLLAFDTWPREDLLEVLDKKYHNNPALKVMKNVNALEVDHIWEVQFFSRAVRDIEIAAPGSFTIPQLVHLSESIVNDASNLTVTLGSINRAKGSTMKNFLKKYGRDNVGADCAFDQLLIDKPSPVLRSGNFPPSPYSTEDVESVNIVKNLQEAMCAMRRCCAAPSQTPYAPFPSLNRHDMLGEMQFKLVESMKEDGVRWVKAEIASFERLYKVLERMFKLLWPGVDV